MKRSIFAMLTLAMLAFIAPVVKSYGKEKAVKTEIVQSVVDGSFAAVISQVSMLVYADLDAGLEFITLNEEVKPEINKPCAGFTRLVFRPPLIARRNLR